VNTVKTNTSTTAITTTRTMPVTKIGFQLLEGFPPDGGVDSSCAPQLVQKLLPSFISLPQLGHSIMIPPDRFRFFLLYYADITRRRKAHCQEASRD
jgi:hypothetical protein